MTHTRVGRAGVYQQNLRRKKRREEGPMSRNPMNKQTSSFMSGVKTSRTFNDFENDDVKMNLEIGCFEGASIGCPREDEVDRANVALFEYAASQQKFYVTCDPFVFQNKPLNFMRKTSKNLDFCFNPLQALRGWALLANVSKNKTLDELLRFVSKRIDSSFGGKKEVQSMNETLLNLHVDIEEDIPGCVRLFTDLQQHLQPDEEVLKTCSQYFGGKSERTAIQHLCFGTDPDGFYSCYRINEEMSISTKGAVKYVVPEEYAPNWRSNMCVASCSDCTFYWKTEGHAIVYEKCSFTDDTGTVTKTPALYAKADYKVSPTGVYQFQSCYSDIYLYVMKCDNETLKADAFISEIATTHCWPQSNGYVLLPNCITSSPMSLSGHARKNGLDRLFCSEKSELVKLSSFSGESKTNFTTLWDHYHKTTFQITTDPPRYTITGSSELNPAKSHMCTNEENIMNISNASDDMEVQKLQEIMFKYYEEHLDQNLEIMLAAGDEKDYAFDANCVKIDSCFSYVVMRECATSQIVLCVGRFNNAPFPNNE